MGKSIFDRGLKRAFSRAVLSGPRPIAKGYRHVARIYKHTSGLAKAAIVTGKIGGGLYPVFFASERHVLGVVSLASYLTMWGIIAVRLKQDFRRSSKVVKPEEHMPYLSGGEVVKRDVEERTPPTL